MTFICPHCQNQIEPHETWKHGIYHSVCPECGKKNKRWRTVSGSDYMVDKKGTITRKVAKPRISKAERKSATRAKHNKE